MFFQSEFGGADRGQGEPLCFDVRLQVESDGSGVAEQFLGRLLERHVVHSAARAAGAVGHGRREQRLARAGLAREQGHAADVDALAAEHRVEGAIPGRQPAP